MIRVVFADDDPNILEAMRRTLHNMRDGRAMEFTSSAERLVQARQTDSLGSCEGELEPGLLEELGLQARWPAWLAELNALDTAEATA